MKNIIFIILTFFYFKSYSMTVMTSSFNPRSVVSSTVANGNYSTTADQYGDSTSISLPAGKWLIFINVTWLSNGATTTTYVNSGVSTTSGNSSTGLTLGQTYVSDQKNTSSDTRTSQQLIVSVSPTTTTTYYLKTLASNSITNLQRSASMIAWEVSQ